MHWKDKISVICFIIKLILSKQSGTKYEFSLRYASVRSEQKGGWVYFPYPKSKQGVQHDRWCVGKRKKRLRGHDMRHLQSTYQ